MKNENPEQYPNLDQEAHLLGQTVLPEVSASERAQAVINLVGRAAMDEAADSPFIAKVKDALYQTSLSLALSHGFMLAPDQAAEPAEIITSAPVSPLRAAKLLQDEHFVREAPHFGEQISDATRTNLFEYVRISSPLLTGNAEFYQDVTTELTEHVALDGLKKFLHEYSESRHKGTDYATGRDLREVAQGILENLNFIGQKEYEEATAAFAVLWKNFLDESPENQICILTKISKNSMIKSDKFLLEQILAHFTPEELEAYEHRISTELEDVTADPEHTRIILLDDWTISGSQIKQAYDLIEQSPRSNKFKDSIEINLLISTKERIRQGFNHDRHTPLNPFDDIKIPLRAYYVARRAKTAKYGAHITGTHSSVDYDFEEAIASMVREINASTFQGDMEAMPPLTNIKRKYRNAKLKLSERVANAKPRPRRSR